MVPLGVIGLVLLVLLAGFFALRRRK
jgi:LPXTG-motif cell wall-anchored protein